MSQLNVIWQPKQGDARAFKVPQQSGAGLKADRVAPALEAPFPLVVSRDDAWVVAVPRQSRGTVYKQNGQEVPLGQIVQHATWLDKSQPEGAGAEVDVARFKLSAAVPEANVAVAGGTLTFKVDDGAPRATATDQGSSAAAATAAPASAKAAQEASVAQAEQPSSATPAAGGRPTPPAAPAPAPGGGAKPPTPPAKGGGGGGGGDHHDQSALAADFEKHRGFTVILALTLIAHIALMVFLGTRDVPEDAISDPTQLPERFAKLMVTPEPEEEPEESGGGGDQAAEQPQEQPEEQDAGDGGGDQQKDDGSKAARSAEEIRDAVRTKGILAVFASKREGGGALSDVLSEGGIASGLDQALGDVGGVVVAQRGMDVRGPRGAGGGQAADIGSLEAGSGRGMGLGDKAGKKIEAGVKTASFTSQGSLSADSIRAVVEKELRGVKYCYEKELSKNPELQGKIVVKFTIGLDGSVTRYEIESSTMGNAEVEGCILKRLRRWEFPKPEKDAVTVSYPFIFTATG